MYAGKERNRDGGDGCSADCRSNETCGNRIIDRLPNRLDGGVEQCDDGNLTAGDGCSPFCLLEYCGNGIASGCNGAFPVASTLMLDVHAPTLLTVYTESTTDLVMAVHHPDGTWYRDPNAMATSRRSRAW